MVKLSRRSAIGAMGAVLAVRLATTAAHAQDRNFTPPLVPMRFTRKLTRELADGALIDVTRAFEVRFSPLGQGHRITGAQTAIEVNVPAGLEGLAGLEKQRDESGLFPILLGSGGLILNSNPSSGQPAIDEAVARALVKLAEGDGENAGAFLHTLQNSASQAMNRLPRDLFAPSAPDSLQTRSLPLPDGGTGQIKIAFKAQTSDVSGLMTHASRIIETSIDATTRTSIERWSLAEK